MLRENADRLREAGIRMGEPNDSTTARAEPVLYTRDRRRRATRSEERRRGAAAAPDRRGQAGDEQRGGGARGAQRP